MSASLDKLGKILALADGGTTDEERDAFLRKAEELAAVIGVELAVARAHHADKSKREVPEKRAFKVGNERSKTNAYMVELFTAISHPHDVKCTIGYRNIYCFGYGLPSDLDIVDALFGVSVVQMVSDADKALKEGRQKEVYGGYGIDGRIYRTNFYKGFIRRLETRLWHARRDAIRSAGGDSEAAVTGTEVVLRDKAAEVQDFYDEDRKHISRRGTWSPPEQNNYVRDAAARGSASAASTDLNLANRVGTTKKGALRS